jgi:hypothetical protein
MNLITEINIPKSKFDISYRNQLVMFGSCFSENIGKKLTESKFRTDVNPFGILYNPSSIGSSIKRLIYEKHFSENELFSHKEVWNSFSHHGSFSDISKEKTLKNINDRLLFSSNNLKKADFLILTFGTAWIYEEKATSKVVANCHKLPEKTFNRRRLSVEEIVCGYSTLLFDLRAFNPNIKIIFTVSPVRHWKDGAHENQLSKSTLLLAIDELQKNFNFIDYFPAYEIVMDELRDYRFYEEDMLHPNSTAINYIWEKFSETYFSAETQKIKEEIIKITKAESHKAFNPDTKEHQVFLQKLKEKKKLLTKKYPFIEI